VTKDRKVKRESVYNLSPTNSRKNKNRIIILKFRIFQDFEGDGATFIVHDGDSERENGQRLVAENTETRKTEFKHVTKVRRKGTSIGRGTQSKSKCPLDEECCVWEITLTEASNQERGKGKNQMSKEDRHDLTLLAERGKPGFSTGSKCSQKITYGEGNEIRGAGEADSGVEGASSMGERERRHKNRGREGRPMTKRVEGRASEL